MRRFLSIALGFGGLVAFGLPALLRGQAVGVSSITTSFSAGTSSKSKLASGSVTFDHDDLSIVQLTDTSGVTYSVSGLATSAILRTDTSGSGELNQTSTWYMGAAPASTSAAPTTIYGTYNSGNPASLLLGNNLLEGSDDVFVNSSSTTAAQGNVERLDFLYNGTAGVVNDGTLAIGVFDQGTGDAFSIAVITGVDSNGNPTSYAGFDSVSNTAFTGSGLLTTTNTADGTGPTILDSGTNPSDFLVRYDSSTSLSTRNDTSDNASSTQNVTGVVISLASLGIASGTTIYGYSLMGGDVTPTGTTGTGLNSLTNYSNTAVFKTTTTDGGAFDGLDPVAVNGVLFTTRAIPEPSAYAEIFLCGAIALYGWRRKVKRACPAAGGPPDTSPRSA